MTLPFLLPFLGKQPDVPPCWFMRQAGRYLPEYRELRASSGGFLPMCYTPELATEITLQPIRRFGMDAAIIFSDILLVPQGLGRPLEFIPGTGPWMEPLKDASELQSLDLGRMRETLEPVYEALRQTRAALPSQTALIGFAGAPWTLLCYMLDGNGKHDFMNARTAIYHSPDLVRGAMRILTEAVSNHLCHQIDAGAQAVQLFDSWAAHVPYTMREDLLYNPAKMIVARLKEHAPGVPVICFPRGVGAKDYVTYVNHVQPDGLSVDQFTNICALKDEVPANLVLQGNIDPFALIHHMGVVRDEVKMIRRSMAKRPFVMNLGHGVHKTTPPEHMQELIDAIRSPLHIP